MGLKLEPLLPWEQGHVMSLILMLMKLHVPFPLRLVQYLSKKSKIREDTVAIDFLEFRS